MKRKVCCPPEGTQLLKNYKELVSLEHVNNNIVIHEPDVLYMYIRGFIYLENRFPSFELFLIQNQFNHCKLWGQY